MTPVTEALTGHRIFVTEVMILFLYCQLDTETQIV
jgi:hypothetical protein